MKIEINERNVSTQCGTFTTSASLTQVSRTLNVELLTLSSFSPTVGDFISVTDESDVIFEGFIWSLDGNSKNNLVKLTAMDPLIYLTKNPAVKVVWNKTKASEIISAACQEAGLKFDGKVEPDNAVTINAKNKTIYEVIKLTLEELKKQTGKRYHAEYNNKTVSVVVDEKTASNVISYREDVSVGTIITKTYKESLDQMISKVVVTDNNGKIKSAVSSPFEKKFGSISTTVSDASKVKAAIKPPTVSLKVGIIADWTYKTGRAVQVESGGLRAHFLITADKHTYSSSVHTADLTLERWQ